TMITFCAIFGLITAVKSSDINGIRVQTVRHGDDATIKCGEKSLKDHKDNLVWYKQSFGKVPQYVVRTIKNTHRMSGAFNDGRYSVTWDGKRFDMNIAGIKEEDTATYFCAQILENIVEFGSGTLLVFQAVTTNYQVPTQTVSLGGESVPLQCAVRGIATSCADEQSVYWVKHGSGESHPGIIYTHGDSSVQCERSSEADFPTRSCIYTLLKSNPKPVDNGIYYCAVAACGTILLGNGTKLDVKESNHWSAIVLITSNVLSVIVILVLVGVILTNRKGSANGHPSKNE
ncbi:putative immune-type receptor 1 precursor, partial [Clarias magur]